MDQEKELLEARYERYRNTLKNLTLMSDILIRNVLKDERCTEYILQVILGDKELTVVDQKIQADYKNLHGRSAVLDCIARDRNGRVFNVEIQQDDAGAQPKRARYHLGACRYKRVEYGRVFRPVAGNLYCVHHAERCSWIWIAAQPYRPNDKGER